MCAIVDASVVGTVFGLSKDRPAAAQEFFEWVDSGRLVLVIGGKLKAELLAYGNFGEWLKEALRNGAAHDVVDSELKQRGEDLRKSGDCRSNDTHVLALAQVSGARLLYTNDQKLIDDFKNRALISRPAGKVYKTPVDGSFTDDHRKLLGTANCRR